MPGTKYLADCPRCPWQKPVTTQNAAVTALLRHTCKPMAPKPKDHVPARERTPFGQFQLHPSHLKTEIPGAKKFAPKPDTEQTRITLPDARPTPKPARTATAAPEPDDEPPAIGGGIPPVEVLGQALCAQADPEEWFPEKGGTTRHAKAICWSCPVREQCLQWALDNGERFGIWGGYSERERRRIAQDGAAA